MNDVDNRGGAALRLSMGFISLVLILFFPSSLAIIAQGKEASLFALGVLIVLMFIAGKGWYRFYPESVTLFFILGLIISTRMISDISSGIIGLDFYVLCFRVIVIFFCFQLAMSFKLDMEAKSTVRIIRFYIFFNAVLILIFLAKDHALISNFLFLRDLYVTKSARFSGLNTSVNYLYSHVLTIFLITYFANRNRYLKRLDVLALLVVVAIMVILSGSKTSLVIIGLLAPFLIFRYRLWRYCIMAGLSVLVVAGISGYVVRADGLSRMVSFFTDVQSAGSLHTGTFGKRMGNWIDIIDIVGTDSWFGYGNYKNLIVAMDNMYLWIYVNAGFFGLMLWAFLMLSMLNSTFKSKALIGWDKSFIFICLICIILANYVGLGFYELRSGLTLAFLMGMVFRGLRYGY